MTSYTIALGPLLDALETMSGTVSPDVGIGCSKLMPMGAAFLVAMEMTFLFRVFASSVLAIANAQTFAAPLASIRGRISIFRRHLMASSASRFATQFSTSPAVDLMADRLQMAWITTGWFQADMVQFHTLWNWTSEKFIDKAMGVEGFPVAPEHAVTFRRLRARPSPMTRFGLEFDLISDRFWNILHMGIYQVTHNRRSNKVNKG